MSDWRSDGGTCATPPPGYDVFSVGLEPDKLADAVKAVEASMGKSGLRFAYAMLTGEIPLILAPETDECVETIARVAITEYNRRRSPVLSSLPPIGTARGGIRYLSPPVVSARRQAWNAWGPRRKVVAVRRRMKRQIARVGAFRKRVADTKAVWYGTKDAYSDAEIEKLTEDSW